MKSILLVSVLALSACKPPPSETPETIDVSPYKGQFTEVCINNTVYYKTPTSLAPKLVENSLVVSSGPGEITRPMIVKC